MRLLLLLSTLLVSSTAFAQLRCMDKLLPAPIPSASHLLTRAEWTPTPGNPTLGVDEASRAVKSLVFGKLLCRQNEIELTIAPSCLPLDPTIPELSTACYVPTSLGYFVLTLDNGTNMNLVFHRVKAPRAGRGL